MKIRKFGAIDIGSNGVRMLISDAVEQKNTPTIFTKDCLIRVPIRLGLDVFAKGNISTENKNHLIDTLIAFSHLMRANKVEYYRICATSAMREANNSSEIKKEIFLKTGINIEIISGSEEAQTIASAFMHKLDNNKNYLYMDVGGGSTELTLFSGGAVLQSESFAVGAVRLLTSEVTQATWFGMKNWLEQHTKNLKNIFGIGTGGNINRAFKDAKLKKDELLSLSFLKDYHQLVNGLTYQERLQKMDIKPDRADVLPFALSIYINIMQWANINKILVPKIGLVDGIVRKLYYSQKTI